MATYFRNLTPSLILTFPLLLTAFCLLSLLASPYTGIRLSLEEKSNIATVDPESPAARAGIKPGDLIVAVNGREILYPSLVFEPDFIGSRQDLKRFWDTQRFLDQTLSEGESVTLLIEKREGRSETILTPVHFPPGKAVGRLSESYLINWIVFFIFYLLFRRKQNEITVLFLLLASTFVLGDVSAGTYQERDLTFPYLPARLLDTINYLSSALIYSVLLHLAFVFPRRKKILAQYPWLLKAIYPVMGFLALIDLFGLFDDPSFMAKLLLPLSKTVFIAMLFFSLLTEGNPVYRKQIQWVVFGFIAETIPRVILYEVPMLHFGAPVIQGNNTIFMLTNLILPVSVVIAVTRYRLMDIDVIFDKIVIYGSVLAILIGVEWLLISKLSVYYVGGIWTRSYVPLLLVLPIVFLYIPLRNGVRLGIQRFFKRKPYKVEEEVRRFITSLGVNPGLPALKKFALFIREMFAPVGIYILERSAPLSDGAVENHPQTSFSLYLGEGNTPKSLPDAMDTSGGGLWQYFETNRSATYGYELYDKGIIKSSDMDNTLWIPIFVESRLSYLVLLLEKWNNTAYSVNDRALLDAVSLSVGHILETEEVRKGMGEVQEQFQKQKDEIMKEIHDGLGSILAHVTMASQVLERSYQTDENTAKKMIGIISESSQEATDFLRAGLTILDHPGGKFGELLPDMKYRLGNMLRAYGIDLDVNMAEAVREMKITPQQNLHLFRCLQETVHNVLKHSHANHVSITFCSDRHHLKMTIADNGRGFEVSPQTLQGYGLRNMFQRMEALGGIFEVFSAPGMGTKLSFAIPVSSPLP